MRCTLVSSATVRRLAIAFVLLEALLLSACSNAPAVGQPTTGTFKAAASGSLVAKSSTVDLGRVPFDVQAEGRFELVNTGAQPVRLLDPPQVTMLEGC